MVHSQWKYRCNIVNKREEDGLQIKHHEWLKVQDHIQLAKGTERMEEEDHYLVWMTIVELWAKWDSDKIIWLCVV